MTLKKWWSLRFWCKIGMHRWGIDFEGCHAACLENGCETYERTNNPGVNISEYQVLIDHAVYNKHEDFPVDGYEEL